MEHRRRSWWHFATTVTAFVVAIGFAASPLPWFLRLLASVVVALLHIRLFVIYHDHQHEAILTGSRFASAFFWLYGLLTLAPPSIWRHTHDHHHINNCRRFGVDSIGSFPVLTTREYQEAGRAVRFFYALSRHPLTILFGYLSVFLYGFCIRPLLRDPRRHLDSAAAILVHGGLLVALALTRPDVMLFAALLPSLFASTLGSYLFYAQHNFPDAKLRPGADWDYVFAALRSSSFLRTNPVMHWFTGNIGFHHVHHLNSRIPFYRLPEAMGALDELRSPGTTSLRPADILRCLRLKLWDPEKDRFVSFAEARAAKRSRPRVLRG